MKILTKKNLRFLTVLAVAFMFTACGEDEEPLPAGPTIIVTETTFTGVPGDVASTNITGLTPGGFNVLRVSKTIDGIADDSFSEEHVRDTDGQENYSVEFTYILVESEVGKAIEFTFLAVDNNSMEASTAFAVTTEATPIPVTTWSAKLLYAPTGDFTSNTFFSTSTGVIHTVAAVNSTADPVSKTIDFGYFYGVTAKASLINIATYDAVTGLTQVADWGTKNATKFALTAITADDFDGIGELDGAVVGVYLDSSDNVPTDGDVTGLTEGDVVSFSTDETKEGGSKSGLIKIVKLFLGADGTGYASDAYIEIEVKM